jgi:hypothetical protein
MPRFYQQLFSRIGSYQEVGNHIIKRIKTAQAFRQVEQVRELSTLLINFPIKEYRVIAQYHLVWCDCRELKFNNAALETIIEQTKTYKTKALTSRGTFEWYKGNNEAALYFYSEALKASPTISEYIDLSRAIAVLKAQEGFKARSIQEMETLIPLIRHAEPLA